MRLLRLLAAAIAVVALASTPALANPKNALDAYVAKPYSPRHLLAKIKQFLEQPQ